MMWRSLSVAVVIAIAAGCSAPSAPAPQNPPPDPQTTRSDPDAELEERTRAAIVAHQSRLRACYEDALVRAPEMAGRVVMVVDVGQNGRAAHVFEGRREGLSDDLVRCLAQVLKTIAFHDGAARTVRIQVPLAFSAR